MKDAIHEFYSKKQAETQDPIALTELLLANCWIQPFFERGPRNTMLRKFRTMSQRHYVKQINKVMDWEDKSLVTQAKNKDEEISSLELNIQSPKHIITAIALKSEKFKSLFPRKDAPIGRFKVFAAVIGTLCLSIYLAKQESDADIDIENLEVDFVIINHDTQTYKVLKVTNFPNFYMDALGWWGERDYFLENNIGFNSCAFCNHRKVCSKEDTVKLSELETDDWVTSVNIELNLELMNKYDEYLDNMNKKPSKSHNDGWLHPSEMCIAKCPRRFYYGLKMSDKVEKIAPFLRRIFDAGHIIHEILQDPFSDTKGMIVEELVEDVEHRIHGHSDLVSETSIGEIKSAGNNSWQKLSVAPKKEHIMQASLYGEVLGKQNINFLYFNKNTAELTEVKHEVDYGKVDDLKARAKEILRYVADDELPPKSKSKTECRNCPYEHICQK